MNKVAFNTLFILIFTALLGCEDEVLPDTRFFKYKQTQCADPWGNTQDSEELRSLVRDYLLTKDIEVLESSVSAGDIELCNACSCLSGRVLRINVNLEDGQRLMDLDEGWEEN
ncbi:MAG: hypothetical protein AAF696_33265 [Bacteroidota bacterium]